jgi:hypothetical protein
MGLADFITVQNITFLAGSIMMIFTVWTKITGPQKKLEISEALQKQKDNIYGEIYEKRFTEIQTQIATLTTMNQNHIHTLETKIDGLTTSQNQTGKEIVKLETTIALLLKLPSNTTNIIQSPAS